MAKPRLNFVDYVKAAFRYRYPVPLLGRMPLNLMGLSLFALLGFANPGFWLLGAAAEVAYLTGLAGSERFQKVVQGERLLTAQREWNDKIYSAVARLSPESRERYRRLLAQCRRVLGISRSFDAGNLDSLEGMRGQALNQLLWIFLRLLTSREVIESNVKSLDREELEGEVEQLERRLGNGEVDPDSALARSLKATLEIQKKRLENLERATESMKVVDSELQRIEQQVELLREEAAVSGKPEVLSDRLDSVTTTMAETTRWMEQHSDLLGSWASEGGAAVTADLPPAPPVPESLSEDGG